MSTVLSTPPEQEAPLGTELADSFDLIIAPGNIQREYWKDLWRYRGLFYFLAWRDVLVRYKQAVFGVAWALVRPLVTMVLFTFVFGKIAKLPSNGIPYSIFVLAGMLPWQLFSSALSEASNSLITNVNLVTKIYFPRMIIPGATIFVNLLDFFIGFAILLCYMAVKHVWPSPGILLLPVFILQTSLLSMAFGLYLAALNVRYRDFRFVIPFILQFGIYISPVGYTTAVVPTKYLPLYVLNPMTGIIEGFRWCLFGISSPTLVYSIGVSVGVTVFSLWCAVHYFRKTERGFADVI